MALTLGLRCLHLVLALIGLIVTVLGETSSATSSNTPSQGLVLEQSAEVDATNQDQVQLVHVTTLNVVRPQAQGQVLCDAASPREIQERERLLRKIARDDRAWDSKHPRWSILEALLGFHRYREITGAEIDRFDGLYKHVPKKHKKLLETTIQYHKTFAEARSLLDRNAKICKAIVETALDFYNISHSELDEFANGTEIKPGWRMSVSQGLKHMVRDWSVEGQTERKATFPYIVNALAEDMKLSQKDGPGVGPYRVLVPGSGLGRLAHDIDHQLRSIGNVAVTLNEYSAYMNIAYRYIASRGCIRFGSTSASESTTPVSNDDGVSSLSTSNIDVGSAWASHPDTVPLPRPGSVSFPFTTYPFIETWSHARTRHELFRPVVIPDAGSPIHSSGPVLVEGDFTREFAHEPSQYDAIATLFFIDTARNLILYLETIHTLLKPGGVWVNVGPLLYGSAPWVQLSLDELITVAEAMGFEFEVHNREEKEVMYNFNASALWRNGYVAQYWVARKKDDKKTRKMGLW
ncbi:hypothetical protein HRR83_005309 [Exophiala dermatitidis]|uniref:Uncharacterized protein n=2 Tax=Exophiala dermatitidis TaxID=5970 RepID=H6C1Q1_EXODN|nr:uncharacterized protein HMPREF1120_05804 [Exophiala dermatitidis NIH/UT8656]KAJ4512967.1 hypothetical protein HRR75_004734 [Exophiala dermatitidis]EHY57780.1 hypothetical protein HMPREF1120_05804 [Exophiala dermatitidis NIH/UT8656]KAJ4516005.1 hypothetical protein HRR74_005162 [Exophiala dermatitidis]KAJ4518590.1 hypothetical protein HRR73_004171 [Exophiala dermatitidis]KAJ4534099.1 hypothetical protein HRR76_006036 [Exophiala dermatitidis]